MDRLGEEIKGDFFLLPSSVHEIIVAPDDGNLSYPELKEMVAEINATQVAPEDRLTDEVYHYDTRSTCLKKPSPSRRGNEQRNGILRNRHLQGDG